MQTLESLDSLCTFLQEQSNSSIMAEYGSIEDPLINGGGSTQITAQEALKKGNHNTISLLLVQLVPTSLCQAIAPFLAEFFGTMMLTLVIALSVAHSEVLAPLAIGAILMCVIFTYGHLSGAHYNPAVSFAVWARGRITTLACVGYIIFQCLGAVVAGYIAQYIFEDSGDEVPLPAPSVNYNQAFVLECVFTYCLCTTVLNTATTDSIGPNSFYGLAIGFVVMSGAVASGGYSGAVFNPAVACGLFSANGVVDGLGLYWLAPMTGGLASGILFHVMNSEENENIKFD